jgi:hypothetical protein
MSETRTLITLDVELSQHIREFETLSETFTVADTLSLLRRVQKRMRELERSEPAAASVPLRQQVEEAALAYHKATDGTGEGEYGCPGVTCPGVQRLANFWFPFIARALSSAPGEREGR